MVKPKEAAQRVHAGYYPDGKGFGHIRTFRNAKLEIDEDIARNEKAAKETSG